MEPTRLVELSGTPFERGRQHGQALAEAIARLYERYMKETATGANPLAERDLVAWSMSNLPESRAYAPDLVEEVDGIAEGAGMSFDKVWFLNCFDEAGAYRVYRDRNATGHACTTFAATGLSTTDGTTYAGQGWDMGVWWDSAILKIAKRENEPEAVIYTHPGIVGGSGLNAAGLALVWATLHTRDMRVGVPVTFLVRKALQQTMLSQAVGAAIGGVRAGGFWFIIAVPFGAVGIEAAATRHHIRYIGRHLGHANHYEERELLEIEGGARDANPTSLVRSGRMNQLLDQMAGRIDLAACKTILCDHANYPGSLCCHDVPPRNTGCTRSLLYVPAQGLMLASNAEPCCTPYEEYRLDVKTDSP